MKQNERLHSGKTVWFGKGRARIFIFLSFPHVHFHCSSLVCLCTSLGRERKKERKQAMQASEIRPFYLLELWPELWLPHFLHTVSIHWLVLSETEIRSLFMYINKKREHFVWEMCTSLRLIVGCMGYDCFDVNVSCTIRTCTALGKEREREKK